MGYTHLFSLRASSNPSSLAFAAARNENSLRLPTTEKKKQEKHFYPTQRFAQRFFSAKRGVFAVPCENRMHLGIVQVNLTLLLVFTVFATMMAESWYKTGMGFQIVRKLAFRRKAGRPARETAGLSHHEWGFCGFLSSKEVLRTSSTPRHRRRSS